MYTKVRWVQPTIQNPPAPPWFGTNLSLLAILLTLRVYGSPPRTISKLSFDTESVIRRLDLGGVAAISARFEDKNFCRFFEGKGTPFREKLTWASMGEKIMVTDFDEISSTPVNRPQGQRIRPQKSPATMGSNPCHRHPVLSSIQ